MTPVGMVAPSSRVPKIELKLGLDALRERGFAPIVHPQVRKTHLFWAGTDEERAQAFSDFAHDPRFSVLWSCRGGYGAVRLLPLLKALTAKRGAPPRKLMVGYSDTTALVEYLREEWGWSTLHAPMPGIRRFALQTQEEWTSLGSLIRTGRATDAPFEKAKLSFISGTAPRKPIEAPLVGGNLCVLTSMIGLAKNDHRGKILFLEDVDEPLYRLDRMFQQLVLSGGLAGVRAVVLGNFLSCQDAVGKVLGRAPRSPRERERMLKAPKPSELVAIRPTLPTQRTLEAIFGEPCRKLGIPVAFGVPSGHGPELSSLPLGARYSLSPQGKLRLLSWSWMGTGQAGLDPLKEGF